MRYSCGFAAGGELGERLVFYGLVPSPQSSRQFVAKSLRGNVKGLVTRAPGRRSDRICLYVTEQDSGTGSGGNQPVGYGVFGEVGGGMQPELFADAGLMKFDRLDRDAEDRRDLFE